MPLSWNEIKSRILTYAQKWKDEDAEQFPNASLANLYDPNIRPLVLVKNPPGIRQSHKPLLLPSTLSKRNQANRV